MKFKNLRKAEEKMINQEWGAVNKILVSKKVYAESIFDLQSVEKVMGSIAKIDHLPESHTHEQLLLIYNAQSVIKYYKANADHYKLMSKISYALMLLLGISGIDVMNMSEIMCRQSSF